MDLHCTGEYPCFPQPYSISRHMGWVEFYVQAFQYLGLWTVRKVAGGHSLLAFVLV